VQALDRTQPSLPLMPGRAATMTHDYRRHGTTNLYAALNVATGRVLTLCQPRHRHREFLAFLKMVNANVPRGRDLHVIVDNSSTHTHPNVRAWLARHRRVHLHFTPTSSSWLNLVELWFRQITNRRLRRPAFRSIDELVDAIDDWTEHWNDTAAPFVWTKTAEEILAKVRPARVTLTSLTNSATLVSSTPSLSARLTSSAAQSHIADSLPRRHGTTRGIRLRSGDPCWATEQKKLWSRP
jgi:transposase